MNFCKFQPKQKQMSFIGRATSPISSSNHANNEAQLTSRQDLKSHKSITEQFFYFLGMFQFQKCMRLLKIKRTNRSEYNEEVLRCLQKFVACENMYYSAIFSVASNNNNNNNNEKHDVSTLKHLQHLLNVLLIMWI